MLIPLAYAFAMSTLRYAVDVTFDGYLPVFGGKDGRAEVRMGVDVMGLSADEKGNPRACSEIKELKVLLNGTALALTAKNIQTFFPKTTVSFDPAGRILASDAPDVKLPVRLPGLDAKRFPDVTYLPIEFPKEGIEAGKQFVFKKSFGGSELTYTVTPSEIAADTVSLKIEVSQSYITLEDDNRNPVTDPAQATFSVSTDVRGAGTATFLRKQGVVSEMAIEAKADSHATNLSTHTGTDRHLTTKLQVALQKP